MAANGTPCIGLVLGGGGGYGFGFDRGVVDGLIDAGVEVYGAPMMGTSAGAIAAASVLAGLSFEEVADRWEEVLAAQTGRWRTDPYELFAPLFDGVDPTEFPVPLRTVAVQLPRWRRLVMTTDQFRVTDMVAASCAVPPVVRTVVIDGVRYGDGGLVSNASADLATDADVIVVVTPIARPVSGPLGAFGSWQVRREITKWRRRTGAVSLHVPPNETIAARFRPRLSDVADIAIGRSVYDASRSYGREAGARVWELANGNAN